MYAHMGYVEDDLIISLYLHMRKKNQIVKIGNCKHVEFHMLIWKIRALYLIRLDPWLIISIA